MMEEVDNIIIHSLRQIGCDIDETVTNLSGFTTELVIEATVRCLDAIRPGLGLSTVLPMNMAARFRLGATLAQACSDLGYRGDIGYQTFLYSSEADLRRVLMFLIEKLPKESDKTLNEPISNIALLEKSIGLAVQHGLSVSWLPHFCHKKGFRNRGRPNVPYRSVNIELPILDSTKDCQDYYVHYQQPVPDQIQYQSYFFPSVLSFNVKSLHPNSEHMMEKIEWLNKQQINKPASVNHSGINMLKRLPQDGETHMPANSQADTCSTLAVSLKEQTLLEKEEKEELEVEKIKTECETLRLNTVSLREEIEKLKATAMQALTVRENEEKELRINEDQKNLKARTYDLLQDGEENVKKLEAVIESSTNKLIHLANQWEKHRVPLIQKYREEREKHSTKATASQKKVDEIKALKEKEKELQEECRTKDQQYSQLVTEVQKLPKEVNRSAYTQRILEIINNVRKQRDEINKVLATTREIQKQINTLTGRLERSFTVVDELVFRDARTNETSKKVYKLLATLHSDFSELISLVEETGATVREIRDLQEQIDTESAKNVGANLERITADLKQMKQETAALTVQLQSKAT